SPPYLKKSSYESASFFSHFICLYGSEHGGRVEYVTCEFLSCLYGSERVRKGFTAPRRFLSCLYGSELKYYTFSPLLIKQNHPILLQHPFLSLPSSSTNYQQLTFTSKNRVFTVPPHKQKVRNLFRDYGLHQPT
ncbi:TPA: hypothetical protein ACHG03_000573, partial [Escherichia coli]